MKPAADLLSKTQSQTAADLRLALGRLIRSMRAHNSGGLTPSQVSALASIEELGPIRMNELANRESIGAPVATRVAASLEDLGYINRIQDLEDKRACLVQLTPTGRKVLKNLWEERTSGINERIQKLSRAEIIALQAAIPILDKLARGE